MTIEQDLRKQANNIGANVADTQGNDLREALNVLADRVALVEHREHFLECLEACGVDNWDGIDYAYEMLEEQE